MVNTVIVLYYAKSKLCSKAGSEGGVWGLLQGCVESCVSAAPQLDGDQAQGRLVPMGGVSIYMSDPACTDAETVLGPVGEVYTLLASDSTSVTFQEVGELLRPHHCLPSLHSEVLYPTCCLGSRLTAASVSLSSTGWGIMQLLEGREQSSVLPMVATLSAHTTGGTRMSDRVWPRWKV